MKSISIYVLLAASALLLNYSCGSKNNVIDDAKKSSTSTFDIDALKKIIDEKNLRFTNAHIIGDTAFLNNIFTADAKVFAPNTNAVVGRSAIAALNLEYINYEIKEFHEETTALYGSGNYLIDEGNYFMSYGKDSTKENGKYLNVWENVEGDWKIHSNIWNSNAPEPQLK